MRKDVPGATHTGLDAIPCLRVQCVPMEERRAEMADKTYTLSFEQQVARPLPEVFDFFSRAESLEVLTPPWLNFKILEVKPQPVQAGTVIRRSSEDRNFGGPTSVPQFGGSGFKAGDRGAVR